MRALVSVALQLCILAYLKGASAVVKILVLIKVLKVGGGVPGQKDTERSQGIGLIGIIKSNSRS